MERDGGERGRKEGGGRNRGIGRRGDGKE